MKTAPRPILQHRRSLIEGLLFLVLSLALLWHALMSHRGLAMGWELSPYLFPLLIALLLLGLSLALIRAGFQPDADKPAKKPKWQPVAVTAGAALLYALLMPRLGFVLATACFLLGMLLYLGERRPLVLALLPLGFSAAVYLVFGRLLHVMLPHSPLDLLRRGLDLLL